VEAKEQFYVFLMDYLKAFDSVFHDFIDNVAVLKRLGSPRWFINSVRNLFKDIEVCVEMGLAAIFFAIEKSIKQGCPLSPLLFLIAFDVFLTDYHNRRKRAYADDLAAALRNLRLQLPGLVDRTTPFGVASGLCLNFIKSLLVSSLPPSQDDVDFAAGYGFTIVDAGEYLGILFGRRKVVWVHNVHAKADKKFNARTLLFLPLKSSISVQRRIRLSNSHLITLYSYVGRFYFPPAEANITFLTNLRA